MLGNDEGFGGVSSVAEVLAWGVGIDPDDVSRFEVVALVCCSGGDGDVECSLDEVEELCSGEDLGDEVAAVSVGQELGEAGDHVAVGDEGAEGLRDEAGVVLELAGEGDAVALGEFTEDDLRIGLEEAGDVLLEDEGDAGEVA